MTYPVLQRVERRDRRRRRRQIMRRRTAALLVLSAAAALIWQLWPVQAVDTVPAAQAGRLLPTRKPVSNPPPLRLLDGPPLLQSHRFAPPLNARSAILVDARTGRVLYERRARVRRPVASTTKIMTALVALQRLEPRTLVTVDRSVPRVPLVREGLRAGERVRAWKLFYGLLLFSGNDDALALAIAARGSRAQFVDAMNAEAKQLGLRDSHFRSPSGVEDRDNYSTAWDLAALTRVALDDPRFRAVVRTKIRHVRWPAPTFAKVYVNHNLLLGTYPGANGVKTGFTTKAGHCLVASATRNGRTLIAVLLDDPNMYADARRLLNLGFRSAA